jgi:transposase-like protein
MVEAEQCPVCNSRMIKHVNEGKIAVDGRSQVPASQWVCQYCGQTFFLLDLDVPGQKKIEHERDNDERDVLDEVSGSRP